MGWEMHQVVVQKLCCHTDRKILKKTAQHTAKKRGTFGARERKALWLGWGTYITFAMWVGGSEDTRKGYNWEVKSRQYMQ